MKINKKIIISIICVVIIIIGITTILLFRKKEEEIKDLEVTLDEATEVPENIDEDVKKFRNKEDYLIVVQCLNKYVSEINQQKTSYYGHNSSGEYTIVVDDSEINNNIINFLSERYINNKNINDKNAKNIVYQIKEKCFYIPISIQKKNDNNEDTILQYAVCGIIENMDYKIITESYILLNIDKNNNTFAVEQVETANALNEIEADKIDNIQKKENNTFEISGKLDEEIAKNYFLNYKRAALGNPKIAYEYYLDREYKEKRFGTIDNYINYINNNKEKLEKINLSKYQIIANGEKNDYVCLDKDNNYYIFRESEVSDYNVLLDTYTIDTQEFLTKYNQADNKTKAGMNVERVIEALNKNDYSYIYNKLADSFKNNYYQSEEKLENYLKQNLYSKNEIEYTKYEQKGSVHAFDVKIKNKENDQEQKEMTILIQLQENTDYRLSFSIK